MVDKHIVMMGIVEQVYQVVSLEKAREQLNCEHKTSWTSHPYETGTSEEM